MGVDVPGSRAVADRVGRVIGATAPQFPAEPDRVRQLGRRQQLPRVELPEPVPERVPVNVTHCRYDRRGFYVFTAGPKGVRIMSTTP